MVTAQSLIIDSLIADFREPQEQELNLIDIYQKNTRLSDQDFCQRAETVIEQIEKSGWSKQSLYDTACLAASPAMSNYCQEGIEIVFLAIENSKKADKKLTGKITTILKDTVADIKVDIELENLSQMFESHERVFDYLGQFFQDRFTYEIVDLVKVSQQTAKKYIKGSCPGWQNQSILEKLAKIFYLQETVNKLTYLEILDWYQVKKFKKGKTIKEIIVAEKGISASLLWEISESSQINSAKYI